MRVVSVALFLLTSTMTTVCEEPSSVKDTIQLKFEVDGQTVSCKKLGVELTLGKRHFTPPVIANEFVVPKEILDVNSSKHRRHKAKLCVTVSCDDHEVQMRELDPCWALPGWLTARISYPTTWFDEPTAGTFPDTGVWVSYLEADCYGCDPGVVVAETHNEIPQAVLENLRREQPSSKGQRARDIAFALAVFDFEYESNRDQLTNWLAGCHAPENDVAADDESEEICDPALFSEIANLYWRGDDTLLLPLLEPANYDWSVVQDAGRFYSDVLDRRTEKALKGISQLPPHKQRAVCARSVEDDLRFDPPKLARVEASLRTISSETASDCLKAIEAAADQPR